jgi:hypothetical protein
VGPKAPPKWAPLSLSHHPFFSVYKSRFKALPFCKVANLIDSKKPKHTHCRVMHLIFFKILLLFSLVGVSSSGKRSHLFPLTFSFTHSFPEEKGEGREKSGELRMT